MRIAAWVSFVLEVAIVGTGGAVRLTDSGLGCEWPPLCTPPDSLFPPTPPEQSYHSLIEFGNRGLSFFVGLAAIVVIVLISRIRPNVAICGRWRGSSSPASWSRPRSEGSW